jgi:hypothetical protein
MKKNYLITVLLSVVVLCSCNRLERINAVRVKGIQIRSDSLSAIVTGEIIDTQEKAEVTDHGFCYAINYGDPRIGLENTDSISLGRLPEGTVEFTDTLKNITPNSVCYVRAFVVVRGTIVYGSVKSFRTRGGRIEDVPMAINLVLWGVDTVTVKGFINRSRVEQEPVVMLQYGTIVSFSPDSTQGASQYLPPPATAGMENFSFAYGTAGIPPSPANRLYVWGVVEYYQQGGDPNDVRRFYTRRKVLFGP